MSIFSGALVLLVAFSVANQAFAYPFATITTRALTASDSPRGTVVGDFNNDGDLDLVSIATVAKTYGFLAGNGDGTFDGPVDTGAGVPNPGFASGAGDFDNDGNLDFAVAGIVVNAAIIALGDGLGGFSTSTIDTGIGAISGVSVADFDNDGNDDVVFGDNTNDEVVILMSNGDDTFATTSVSIPGSNSQRTLVADVNNDTYLDIIVIQSGVAYEVAILDGNGDGTFDAADNVSIAGASAAARGAVGDLDGDGNADLVLNEGATGDVVVSLGNGDGTFDTSVVYSAVGRVTGFLLIDVDGDGDKDIAALRGTLNTVGILINDGNGVFALDSSRDLTTGGTPAGAVLGDFDEDGSQDFAFSQQGDDTIGIFLNTGRGGFTTTESGGNTITAEAGTTDTLSVVLSAVPTADVDIAISVDTQVSVSPTSVTFTTGNWDTAQSVTVSAVNDTVEENQHTGEVTLTPSSSDAFYDDQSAQTVSAIVNDNDAETRSGISGGSSSRNRDKDDDSPDSSDFFTKIREYISELQNEGKALPSWASAFLTLDVDSNSSMPSDIGRDLTLESTGGDVTTLQTFLIDQATGSAATALGNVGATGYFGILTQASLAEYQAAHNINPPQGYFGPITRTYLSSVGY